MFYIHSLFIIHLLLFSVCTFSKDIPAVEILTQKLQKMSSLQATFSQQTKDNKGKVLQQARGKVSVKRPRRLHWHTTEPYEHLLVTDGKILWLYDVDLEQISQQPFTENLDKAPALLLSGEVKQITNQYQVKIIEKTTALTVTSTTFELLPLKDKGLFSRLTLSFEGDKLIAMSLHDSFDQHTVFAFKNTVINAVISDTFFHFSAPQGVDIIKQ